MNPFYDLNKKLDGIRNEPTKEQKALVESQAPKSPAKKTLEEALRTDLRSLMEDATGGMSGSNTLEQNDSISEPEKMDILRHAMKGLPAVDSNRLWSIMIKELSNAYNNMPGGDEWSALKPLMSKFKINWDRFESLAQKHGYNSVSDLFNNIEKERSNSLDEAKDKSLSQAAKTVKKGALHKQEGIPKDKKIGDKKLNSLKKSGTPLEKKRANFALNIQGKGKKSVDESIEECVECSMGECSTHGINELSKGTLQAYKDKVSRGKVIGNHNGWTQIAPGHYPPTSGKRLAGYNKATDKIAKKDKQTDDFEAWLAQRDNENVNELSKGAVVGYKTGAQQDLRKLKQQPVDDFVSNMRQGHRIGDAANMAVQNNLKAIKKAKNRGAGIDRANARLGEEYASEGVDQVGFKSGDRVLYMNKFATVIKCDGETCGIKIDHTPGTMMVPISQIKKPSYDEGVEEGATPAQLDQQTILQKNRAAKTRKNSRAVQQQLPQGGPRRAEVPAFIRKGRGDPALDHTDLEETNMYSESDKDILDYLKAKLVPNGGNARAKSVPYNGSADDADAYNGMEFEESDEYSRHTTSKSPAGGTVYTRKYDPDTGHSIGTDTGAPAASDGPRKRGRQPGTKFSGGYAARHAKMDSRKKDMDEEYGNVNELSKDTLKSYAHKAAGDLNFTSHMRGSHLAHGEKDAANTYTKPNANRQRGIHKAIDRLAKNVDEGSATCPHCGHAMADEGRELDMEGVKNGMGSFVKAAKKIGGVASAVKKAKKDYDGDGKIETGPEEHAGSVDKAIKANKAKSSAPKKTEEATAKRDNNAEKAGKKVTKDIEYDEKKKDGITGKKRGPEDQKAEKAGKKVAKDIEYDEKKGKQKKEEKVDETTTSGSVSTAPAKKSSGGSGVGKGIYDSWERKYESLLKEDVNVTTNSSKNDSGEEEEHITIDVSGDDVARIKEMLHSMGLSHGDEAGHEHGGEEACDTCGGVPCQCDEMNEMTSNNPETHDDDSPYGYEGGEDSYGRDPLFMPHPHDLITDPDDPYFKKDMDEETSFKDAGATIGRIGGTIAGGLGGAAAGLGIGTVPGAVAGGIAGGSAGSALGTAAGRWLDKKTGAPEETDEDMSGHQRMMELAGLGEANVTVSANEPDYPSNQEYSNDAMQYSGGLNKKKSTGQTTVPTVASQINRLHSHVSEGQAMMDLYKAIAAIDNKEV